ncbi:hypothetical protein CDIK_0150 [Cucumispora dikerogammari]|nr:hypothetical protein CDIK_0150 [Cucumispora dikerogammari]
MLLNINKLISKINTIHSHSESELTILVQPLLYTPLCKNPSDSNGIVKANTRKFWCVEPNTLALDFCIEYHVKEDENIKYNSGLELFTDLNITLTKFRKKPLKFIKKKSHLLQPVNVLIPSMGGETIADFIMEIKPFGYPSYKGTKNKCSHVVSFGLRKDLKINKTLDLKQAMSRLKHFLEIDKKSHPKNYAFKFNLKYLSLKGGKYIQKSISTKMFRFDFNYKQCLVKLKYPEQPEKYFMGRRYKNST